MIPKEGKDLTQAGGWRPITVGNLLARVFSGVLESKLRGMIRLSPRQKGFVEGNGCFANIRIMDEVIRRGKCSSLCAAVLDISKAFDCVPREAISRALAAQGVLRGLRDYISLMYGGTTTSFKNYGGFEIEVRRGVKQGDPLSPLLFNLVLNPLLNALEGVRGGVLFIYLFYTFFVV